MIKRTIYGVVIGALLVGCTMKEENERMKVEIEQLKGELETSEAMSQTLEQIGSLLDSIDDNREFLRVDLEVGTTYDDYTNRMRELNEYVENTESRIEELENSLGEAGDANRVLTASLRRFKKELKEKTEEITMLQEQVENYRVENKNLLTTVGLQDAELEDKEVEILVKRQELNLLENRIQEIMISSKVDEADAYFARAEAVEEAAKRTKLAPRKRKESLKEALELYKKAATLGREDANGKVTELEKRI